MDEATRARRSRLLDFEYRVFERLQGVASLRSQRLLVAVSGGLDSIALAHCLLRIAPKLDLELAIVHCHHGQSESIEQGRSRDTAEALVREFAKAQSVAFYSVKASADKDLRSEAELRDFRIDEISKIAVQNGFSFAAFGHHADDLLETRLLRLIRGTSGRGLRAMALVDSDRQKLRPFLSETRSEIESYARLQGLTWIEDPSNSNTAYLRNWIRREWLPALEAKQAGSTKALARSLETLSQDAETRSGTVGEVVGPTLSRQLLRHDETVKKRALLANYLEQFGVRDFTQNRIDEVLKRIAHLDSKGQKRSQFQVGGLSWEVTVDSVQAQPRSLAQDAMLLTQDDT